MPTVPHLPPTKLPLRRTLQQQRAALPPSEQVRLSRQAVRHLKTQRCFRNARHIALYLPVRGEADPRKLRYQALPRQQFYLPVLSPFRDSRLWFVRWDAKTRFRLNRFRIPEPYPVYRHSRPARWLDMVVTPLVAFDANGTRMGMGGGFYDRTFAFKRTQRQPQRPRLCGFAYHFQKAEHLCRQRWDIPLDAATSDAGFFHLGTGIY
ncbi:5-formyltetrahydrofolate cyclo-ligase [Thiothrix litoralis]|uniref:5-formyltetrahydrofolate cyclo-ligase n=1 Tax=Thiothrix litoralis TaxID=2891210 RepID=A0ABX7WV24_9GAMM|nr:5-formyltetrahydrofolate cyclo-ligase [Thiothrix litoralis]QTR44775.1 5-formyltetrahydrofolate cyclo-ligase [Thiothrix litoralis]